MDLLTTGKFIAEKRKGKNLTQAQLAEKLFVSEKTISKWECRKGFPDTSLILPLCEELGISANELLSGRTIAKEEYQSQAENNLMSLISETKKSKVKIAMTIVLVLGTTIPSLILIMLAGLLDTEVWVRALLIGIAMFIILISLLVGCFLDNDYGSFECNNCGHKFVPSFSAYVFGIHTLTRRHLKCPKCGKRTWCKRRLTK